MPEKWRPLNCLLIVLAKQSQQNLAIFLDCFNKTIISLTLVRCEMVIANSALRASLAIYLTNRFHFAVRLYSDNAQMTSKRGENKEVRYEP